MVKALKTTGWLLCVAALLGVAACSRPGAGEGAAADQAGAPRPYAQGDTVQVTGVLVDTRCFHLDRYANRGVDHERPEGHVPGCAAACARQGWPVAVLEDGRPAGHVWVLSFPSPAFADYMAKTVRVQGDFRAEGILVPLRVEMQADDGSWTTIL